MHGQLVDKIKRLDKGLFNNDKKDNCPNSQHSKSDLVSVWKLVSVLPSYLWYLVLYHLKSKNNSLIFICDSFVIIMNSNFSITIVYQTKKSYEPRICCYKLSISMIYLYSAVSTNMDQCLGIFSQIQEGLISQNKQYHDRAEFNLLELGCPKSKSGHSKTKSQTIWQH